jgi:hypothetical protein
MVRKILAALTVALGVSVATPTIAQMPYGVGAWRFHVQFRSGRGWPWRHYAWTRSRTRAYRMAAHLRAAGFQARVLRRLMMGYGNGYGSYSAYRPYRRYYGGSYTHRYHRRYGSAYGGLNAALAQMTRSTLGTAQAMQRMLAQQTAAAQRVRATRVQSYVASHPSPGQHAAVQRAARQRTRSATVARAPIRVSSAARAVAHTPDFARPRGGGMAMPRFSAPRMPTPRMPTAGFHAAAHHAAVHYGGGGGFHMGGMGHAGGGGGHGGRR